MVLLLWQQKKRIKNMRSVFLPERFSIWEAAGFRSDAAWCAAACSRRKAVLPQDGLLHGRPEKQSFGAHMFFGLFPEVCQKTVLLPESFAPSAAMTRSPAFFIQSKGVYHGPCGVSRKNRRESCRPLPLLLLVGRIG